MKKPAPPNPTANHLANIDRRFSELMTDIQALLHNSDENWGQLSAILDRMTSTLHRLRKDNGLCK